MALLETLALIAVKVVVIIIKLVLIYAILVTCHHGLEDDRQGSVNERSAVFSRLIPLLFVVLTVCGIYGVYISHLGLFFTWFLLRPIVYILELESGLWTAIAMSLIASGGTLSYVLYDTMAFIS